MRLVTIGILALVLAGYASASEPTAQPSTSISDNDRNGFVLLVLGPKPNPIQNCAVAALRQNVGLMELRIAKASDDFVEQKLKESIAVADTGLTAFRQQQIDAWKASHNPGQLAMMELEYCQSLLNIQASLGQLGKTCFSLAAIPATAEALKSSGMAKDQATNRLVAAFGSQVSPDFISHVSEEVFSMDAETTQYEAHRKVLAFCVRDTR